jgi:3-hydroxybutyryl-CoA dehydrogenase
MNVEEIRTVGVVGAGSMGTGIIQVAAQSGFEVKAVDVDDATCARAAKSIAKILERLVAKEKITEEQKKQVLGRISFSTDVGTLTGVPFLFEAVFESVDVKKAIFSKLDAICGDEVIYATNTSSLSITEMASLVKRPAKFVGMHFFNPVPAMKLVEIVRGLETSDATAQAVTDLAERLDKVPVAVRDMPGFVVNRVVMPMINEAATALQQGVADAKSIDECMKLGCNHPLGPLALADLVGLDVVHAILESLYKEYGEQRYAPCIEIKKRVEAGFLGRKSGRGFYQYDQ